MSADARLVAAVQQGNLDAIKEALDSGADPDARDTFLKQTVLCFAILSRKLDVAMVLLDRGADPSLKGAMQRPTGAAASQGQLEIMRRLLAMGSEIDGNASTLAEINDHAEIVALLAAEQERRAAAEQARLAAPVPAILPAAAIGDLVGIRAALAAGASLDVVNENGWSPLMLAAGAGHLDAVVALLAANAPATTAALLAAIQSRDPEIVRTMLRAGVDVDAAHATGMTPLLLACKVQLDALVTLLLDEGADANGRTPNGWTPLMVATQAGSETIVAILIARGGDVNAADTNGATALMNAAGSAHTAIVGQLLAAGARTDAVERQIGADALGAAGIGGNAEIIGMLLAAGVSPNRQNEDGFTPLVYCAARGDVDSVKLLLGRGADAELANNFGETPLLRAAAAGHADVVTALVDAGVAIDHASKEGLTALMLAADKGHADVVRLLLAARADRTRTSLGLRTAYDYARIGGHLEIEAILAPPPRELPQVTPRAVSSDEAQAATKRLVATCWSGDVDQAAAAIGDGALVDGSGDDIPILCAASAGATDLVRLLLAHGAKVDASDATGLTALAKACGGARLDMARALIEGGAAVTGDVVACASIHRHPGIMALLEAQAR